MAYVTFGKDGEPWMFCHSTHADEVKKRVDAAKAEAPTSTFAQGLSTLIKSQHCADVMDAQARLVEDPFRFFAVPVIDGQAT